MADQKISELTALTGANLADVDAFAVVDTSAVQTKKITYAELKTALDTGTGFVRITGDTMSGALGITQTGSVSTIPLSVHSNLNSGQAILELRSTGSSNATIDLRADGAGDPQIFFDLNGATPFSIGVDNSDGDKFKISGTSQLGTNPRLTIDSSGNSIFNGNVTVDAGTTTSLIIEKDNTGSGRVAFHNAGTQISYISLDASEDMVYYGGSGVDQIFYAHGAQSLTLTSGAATFAGSVTAAGQVFTNVIGRSNDTNTTIDFPGSDVIQMFTNGTKRLEIDAVGNAAFGGNLTVTGTVLNLPTVNSYITGNGHNVLQVDGTRTYFYGGTNGVQFRTADNASELVSITNAGVVTTVGRFINATGSYDPWLKGVNSSGTETSYIKKDGTANFAGSVGIGATPATNTKLLVKAGTNLNFEVENSSSNLRLSALNDARSANVGMQFASSSFQFLTGNVGINTTNPQVKLQVNDSGTAAPTSGYGTGFNVARSDGLIGMTMGYTSANNSTYIQGRNFTNTDTQPIAINPLGGNVGIGLDVPTAPLEISATATRVLAINSSHSNGGYLTIKESGTDKFYLGRSQAVLGTAGGYTMYAGSGYGLTFNVNGQGSPAMIIDSSQKVGIGISPAANFHVYSSGQAIARVEGANQYYSGMMLRNNYSSTQSQWHVASAGGTSGWGAVNGNFIIRDDTTNSTAFEAERGAGSSTGAVYVSSTGTTSLTGIYSTTNSVNNVLRLSSSSSGTSVAGHGTGIQFLGERNDGNAQTLALIQAVTTTNSGTSIAADLTFHTGSAGAPSEKVRIDKDGKVGIGANVPDARLEVRTSTSRSNIKASGGHNSNCKVEIGYDNDLISGTSTPKGAYIASGSSGNARLQVFVDNTSLAAEFRGNGDFYSNDGTVHSLSDSRVKKDIADLTDGLAIVKQLKPRTFKFNGKATTLDDNRTKYGFIADEVITVAPQYVSVDTQTIDDVEVDDFKSLSTTKMIPMLVKAIQEQQEVIESLTARITTLEG